MKYIGKKTTEISFPLGGIGTGSIGLDGGGRLVDWEIFNRPSKGSTNGCSHFAISAVQGEKITSAVLCGDIEKEFVGQYKKTEFQGYGYGVSNKKMCGFPHFKDTVFDGEFPLASIIFSDESFPAKITMTAFNPFIPLDAKNSSLPAAFFEIEIENITDVEICYRVALSVANPYKQSINETQTVENIKMLSLFNDGADKESPEYGDLTVATDCPAAYTQTYWYRGSWQDGIVSFWNDFSAEKHLKDRLYTEAGSFDTGTLIAEAAVLPKSKKKLRFVLAWNTPNNFNYWSKSDDPAVRKPWKNYYATVFESSAETAEYALKNWDSLYSRTLKFKNALHNSTLPPEVIDAASANLSVLKSPTVLRLEDGSFYGWEGVNELTGSCEGTCQHVWNYAYAMCFLFPELERSVRDTEFEYSTDENGRMGFRTMLPIGSEITDFRACADGQLGAVIKCCREWMLSGDNVWLKNNWESIKKVLDYARSEHNPDKWDRDGDGVLEGRQHHTLDMELFGPSSWLEGMYLAALAAASQMGEFLGDAKKAKEYRALFENGRKWMRENLFNGKYFIQKIDITDKSLIDKFDAAEKYWNDEVGQIKYQIGDGSSIDQMLAQWHADIIGLGEIFDPEQTDTALCEMMKNNFKPSMRAVVNPWRIFSLNDEAGTLICDYPAGVQKPKIPVPYCEETMTGFEYSFAGLLLSRGKIEDGLKVVKAVRDRFDGEKRNPWNEFECGSNYARSMASYALVPILAGFEFDMPHNRIGFNPYKTDDFRCIWSVASAWGVFEIKKDAITIKVEEGQISLNSLGLKFCDEVLSIALDGNPTAFKFENGIVSFDKTDIKRDIRITAKIK